MPSTTKGFPYPANSDNVDIPGDMQALAEAVDTGLNSYLTSASASTTYGLRTAGGPNRNLLYNGAMNVQQYGSAAVAAANSATTYRADRWRFARAGSSAQTYNMEVATDAPSGFPGLKYSSKITVTASASPAADTLDTFGQSIEMQNARILNNVDFTVSFWVKSSVTGSYTFFLTNGVGDPNRREYQTTYTINAANTWEKKSITVPAKDWNKSGYADNGLGLYVAFTLACGSNRLNTTGWFDGGGEKGGVTGATNLCSTNGATWFVTGVQLETGDVATDFEFKSYGQELRECQRYFCRYDTTGNGALMMTLAGSTTIAYGALIYPVEMRTTPTAVTSANLQLTEYNAAFNATAVAIAENTKTASRVAITVASGLTQFRPYVIRGDGTAGAHLSLTAEL